MNLEVEKFKKTRDIFREIADIMDEILDLKDREEKGEDVEKELEGAAGRYLMKLLTVQELQ